VVTTTSSSVLYLHGTLDGCHGMTEDKVRRVPGYCGPGSEAHLIDEVGHFLILERPHEMNRRITDWVRQTSEATLAGAAT
jgi:pimeloyl-ACP methyl ester carboxylesterase